MFGYDAVPGERASDGSGGPPFGPDPDLTLTDGPHATGIVDQILDGSVPFPAIDVGRVAWSSADGRLPTGDGSSDGGTTTGFQRWNTDGHVEDQYETFNGMPVYYGGDLYDSVDSDWDDTYALASAAYVEDYNWCRRRTRITLIRTTAPLRILTVQFRKMNIVLFRTKGPWRTSMWTGWTMWIMMIRMFDPLRILVVAARMLIWRTIVFLI